jgi:hypothetical protein
MMSWQFQIQYHTRNLMHHHLIGENYARPSGDELNVGLQITEAQKLNLSFHHFSLNYYYFPILMGLDHYWKLKLSMLYLMSLYQQLYLHCSMKRPHTAVPDDVELCHFFHYDSLALAP